MGYVTVTESVGEVIKTYHFSSYDDFKDWENKVSGVVVSADEKGWIENDGEYPPKGVACSDQVAVKFKNGEFGSGFVDDFYGWNVEKKNEANVDAEQTGYDITHYRKLS